MPHISEGSRYCLISDMPYGYRHAQAFFSRKLPGKKPPWRLNGHAAGEEEYRPPNNCKSIMLLTTRTS